MTNQRRESAADLFKLKDIFRQTFTHRFLILIELNIHKVSQKRIDVLQNFLINVHKRFNTFKWIDSRV